MVFWVNIGKNHIPHRDVVKQRRSQNIVSNIAFLYEIYWENTTFLTKF